MQAARRNEINKLAAQVRRALDLDVTPFPVDKAVERLGGKVHDVAVEVGDAMVKKDGEGFVIHVTSQPPVRRRFSIAHELGHLFLHMGYGNPNRWAAIDEYLDSPKYRYGFSEEEYEAHEFAAALLMPRDEFERLALRHTTENRIPLKPIADHFQVSTDSARVRGQWLGLFEWNR